MHQISMLPSSRSEKNYSNIQPADCDCASSFMNQDTDSGAHAMWLHCVETTLARATRRKSLWRSGFVVSRRTQPGRQPLAIGVALKLVVSEPPEVKPTVSDKLPDDDLVFNHPVNGLLWRIHQDGQPKRLVDPSLSVMKRLPG